MYLQLSKHTWHASDNHRQQNAILWETLAYHRTAGLSFKGPDEQNQKALWFENVDLAPVENHFLGRKD